MDLEALKADVHRASDIVAGIKNQVRRVIVGQDYLVGRMMIALMADGHCLVEGVPGLAKTTAVNVFSKALDLSFRRMQFTPDLLPADIVGTMVYDPSNQSFRPHKGPVFANLILADEINRAPAKVQSALLEAMQERQVTIGDSTYPLDCPFLVLATQNPIEQEGTYPLPEAQVDRFMMKLLISYPTRDEEMKIMDMVADRAMPQVDKAAGKEELGFLRTLVGNVYVDEKVKGYILDIVRATREPSEYKVEAGHLIEYGASPRASIYLNLTSRAHAVISGRAYVTPQDVKALAPDVLRHRIVLSYEAEAEETPADEVVKRILDRIEVP
ncbi:MAG: AAA family ATPase [Planctomycetes bacterium]|nr:AAA family ATPase [Planctomycetota bacterium]